MDTRSEEEKIKSRKVFKWLLRSDIKPETLIRSCLYCWKRKLIKEDSPEWQGVLNVFCGEDCEDRYSHNEMTYKEKISLIK